ncbi:hypothetical protein Tco_1449295 [Tanacetum coccineum]
MSILAHFDLEIISQTDGAQSSRVPTPLPDDPYVTIPQTLLVVPSPVPSSDDFHLTVGHAHTPTIVDTEFEPEEAPLEIEEFLPLVYRAPLTDEEFEVSEPSDTRITSSHSSASSDSTALLSPDHLRTQTSSTPTPTRVSFHRRTTRMVVYTQPTLSPGMSAQIAEADALSPSSFCKRYRPSYETPSPSSSSTLPIRKRYREDEDPGLEEEEEEEAAPEGQQQAVLIVDITANEPLRLGYEALRHHELELGEGSMPSTFEIGQSSRSMSKQQRVKETLTPRPRVRTTWVDPVDGIIYTDILVDVPPACLLVQIPPSPEWSFGSLLVSPSSSAVPTLVASPVTTPATTIAVDEDEFLEVGAHLELHGSILHDHTHRLDALPPKLFEGYDRDLRELYTRSRDVRDEIFSQRYMFRSLDQEQERATVTFNAIWRPVLAWESWVGYVDAQRAEMW